jgi:hypothetical protein
MSAVRSMNRVLSRLFRRQTKEDPWASPDPALAYALGVRDYYKVRGHRSRRWYRFIAGVQLVASAATALTAAFEAPLITTSTFAFVTLFAGGANTLGHPREVWIDSALTWHLVIDFIWPLQRSRLVFTPVVVRGARTGCI